MKPVVSRFIHDGAADREPSGVLGEPVWGPAAWLRDLELRLGLPQVYASEAHRAHAYARKLAACLGQKPFYSRSFDVDPHGTAATLLTWRDELVEAGWCFEQIPNAGPRVAALVAAEKAGDHAVPLGLADRLARSELELAKTPCRLYESVRLLEPRQVWPEGWRRVMDVLAGAGTVIEEVKHREARCEGSHDLGMTQRILAVPGFKARKCDWRGDGSLLHVTGRTSWELGETIAGLVRSLDTDDVCVIRLGDAAPLEAALSLQGMAGQGQSATSPLRSPLQVLSLGLALLFGPRDPYRALELLTLPRGPFGAHAARMLADAIGRAPGIGSDKWREAKAKLEVPKDPSDPRHVMAAAGSTAKIEAWFEWPVFGRNCGAPRAAVVDVIARVRTWAAGRPHDEAGVNWAILANACSDMERLVLSHPRHCLLPHEIEALASRAIGSGMRADISVERAGRVTHVATPHAILREHDAILVWHAGYEPKGIGQRAPWRKAELQAFKDFGLCFADHERAMRAEGDAWRRAFGSARALFAVATPDAHLSAPQPSLPLWDEIVARTMAAPVDIRRVSTTMAAVLQREHVAEPLAPLSLPKASSVWNVEPTALGRALEAVKKLYPTAVESLVACPLRWVLESVLQVRRSRLSSVPEKTQLYGNLGHRLAENLHRMGALSNPEAVDAVVDSALESLILHEGGPLLMPGMTAERGQVCRVLIDAMRELSRTIAESQMEVVGVEVGTNAPWGDREISGRIDLLLRCKDGSGEAILDLKYGESRYREALTKGLALQIAMYAETRRRETGAAKPIDAAYFALKKRRAVALDGGPFKKARVFDGEALDETWRKTERMVLFLFDQLGAGVVRASAAAENDSDRFFAHHGLTAPSVGNEHYDAPATSACTYCSNGALCGRAWRRLA